MVGKGKSGDDRAMAQPRVALPGTTPPRPDSESDSDGEFDEEFTQAVSAETKRSIVLTQEHGESSQQSVESSSSGSESDGQPLVMLWVIRAAFPVLFGASIWLRTSAGGPGPRELHLGGL